MQELTPESIDSWLRDWTDLQAMLHESGHAFHTFETYKLPYYHQRWAPMEFNEVASTAVELLAAPYLTLDLGGFFAPQAVEEPPSI